MLFANPLQPLTALASTSPDVTVTCAWLMTTAMRTEVIPLQPRGSRQEVHHQQSTVKQHYLLSKLASVFKNGSLGGVSKQEPQL